MLWTAAAVLLASSWAKDSVQVKHTPSQLSNTIAPLHVDQCKVVYRSLYSVCVGGVHASPDILSLTLASMCMHIIHPVGKATHVTSHVVI
jgi:hypothetical protein